MQSLSNIFFVIKLEKYRILDFLLKIENIICLKNK